MLNRLSKYISSNPIGQIFNLGKKTVAWKKVTDLKPGMKIAITPFPPLNLRGGKSYSIGGVMDRHGLGPRDDTTVEFDEIVSIKPVGQEQVYDIEVEKTHNFVGNGIVAHNTYISGNLGIGTTAPAATSILDLTSTTKGFLAPRMDTTQRDAILTPATGLMIYNTTTNQYNVFNGSTWGAVGGGGGAWSDLTVPTTNLTLAMDADTTTFNWDTLTTGTGFTEASTSLSSGTLHALSVNGTAATGNTQKVLSLSTAGANATSTQTTYGLYSTNTHTGTASTNVGGYFSASGATNNYGLIIENGNVGIGTTAPTQALDIVGNLKFSSALLPNGSSGTTGQFLISQGTSAPIWTSTVGATTAPFSGITSGTNTTAAMIIDTGASLNYANSGTINASSLVGATWIAPGTIGSTTPNTGAFTALTSTGNVGIGVTGAGVTNLLTINQAASTTAATVGTYGIDLQDQGSHRLTVGGDANYAYIQTWNSKPLQINNQGNNVLFNVGGGSVGIGTTGPDAKLDSLSTTEQLRLSYTDGSVYSSHTVNSSGDLTIDNTGTQTIIADDLAVNGATSADITTTTTTATVFDSTATTLSLGGAATTALNLGNGSGNYTAINLGSGAGTHTINIAGTGATAADTINIGTGGTGADTINLGSNASTTALNFTSGTGAQTFASSMATGNAFVFNANSLSTGLGLYLSSTSTALSSGSLASLDWSPGSATTATGDLLKLNIGANGLIGNIFNVLDNGSSVFSVSQTAITAGLPASFQAAGDVSIAYDLLLTNQTSSYIKSNGPLYIEAGESWESNDLTLKTYNSGNIILNSTNLWADGSNVGIGTTSPTALLHLGIGSTAVIGQKIVLASGATANAFEINSSSGVGGDKFLIKANGNVGIGTTAPTYQLQTTGTLGIGSTAYFAGSVGIGTTGPAEKLHVGAGNIMIDNNQYIKTKKPGGTVVNMIGMDNSGLGVLNIQIGEAGGKILAHDGSTQRIGIDNNGNVSIGTLAGSGNRAVYSDASGYLTNSSSDIRLKKNIVAISSEIDVLASIDRLRGIYYNWDTSVDAAKNLGSQRELGMIAQEVELVLPELVSTNVTGYKSLDYSKMTGFLIEVDKAQQAKIENISGLGTGNGIAIGGSVGIGTTGPVYRLHVQGTTLATVGQFTNSNYVLNTTGTTLGIGFGATTGDTYATLQAADVGGNSAADLVLQNAGGNVGIGTTAPTSKLDVRGLQVIGETADSNRLNQLQLYADANGSVINSTFNTGGTGILRFQTADNEKMRLSNAGGLSLGNSYVSTDPGAGSMIISGNVGIGTSNPADKLNIVGGGIKIDTTGSVLNLVSGASDSNTFIVKIPEKSSAACGTGNAEGIVYKNAAGTQVGHICISTLSKLRYFAEAFNATSTDLAENYSDASDSLQPGDIVMIDEATPKGVKKSSGSNANKLIGIVSTDPGILLSDINENGGKTSLIHPKPIALNGRVPTKVSTENGPISAGDYLTSSSIPGVAMKATKAGEVIGKALENYNSPDSVQVGSILTFVNLSWYDPDVYFTATGDLHINQNAQGDYAVQNTASQTITDRISTFASSFIANLTAGVVKTQKLFTNELVSPLAEIDTLRVKDNLLSPLATIDTLIATNATISGTLYAASIVSPEISNLQSEMSNISSNYASASAILSAIKAKYSDFDSLNDPNGINDPLSTTDLSSKNSTLSGVLMVDQSQISNLQSQIIFTDTLLVNTSLISNSINSNDTALYIQPTGNQPINLLAGLMILTPDGKVAINGDLTVTGTIYADKSEISNLKSQMATVSGTLYADKSEISNLKSQIITASDLIIASAATESATATVSASLASNASIGTGIIASGSAEVKIENSKIKDSTYVYLTPISDTANQVLYVKNKTTCPDNNCIPSFTVAVPATPAADIKFNYWLIQTQ